MLRHGDLLNAPSGQSSSRWWVLSEFSLGNDSVVGISRTTGNSRQAIQRLTDALVADHLATYGAHTTDRRRQVVTLADRGPGVLDELETRFDEWAAPLVDAFGAAELRETIDRLDAVRRILDRQTAEEGTDAIVLLATMGPDSPTGTFLNREGPLAW